MTPSDFVRKSEAMLCKALPDFKISIYSDPDDDETFYAYIFNVPEGQENEIKEVARKLIRGEVAPYDMIPVIKNKTVTREHYPSKGELK